MAKADKTKTSGYTAVHELPYSDELEGATVLKSGDLIPTGVLDDATIDRLLKKGAIKKTKDVKAEEADAEAEVVADKDPVAAAQKVSAQSAPATATPGPSTTSSSR